MLPKKFQHRLRHKIRVEGVSRSAVAHPARSASARLVAVNCFQRLHHFPNRLQTDPRWTNCTPASSHGEAYESRGLSLSTHSFPALVLRFTMLKSEVVRSKSSVKPFKEKASNWVSLSTALCSVGRPKDKTQVETLTGDLTKKLVAFQFRLELALVPSADTLCFQHNDLALERDDKIKILLSSAQIGSLFVASFICSVLLIFGRKATPNIQSI